MGVYLMFLITIGLLSKAQKEAVGAAERETDLGQELDNGQEDMDDREFERYDIDKRDARNDHRRKRFSTCPRWRSKSRANNQVKS